MLPVQSVLGDEQHRASAGCRLRALAELLEQVRLALVVDGVGGVESQAVQVVPADPMLDRVAHPRAHEWSGRAIEVQGGAPRGGSASVRVGGEFGETVSLRTQVVED